MCALQDEDGDQGRKGGSGPTLVEDLGSTLVVGLVPSLVGGPGVIYGARLVFELTLHTTCCSLINLIKTEKTQN